MELDHHDKQNKKQMTWCLYFLIWVSSPIYRAYLIAQLVKNLPAMQEIPIQFLGWEDHWRRDRLPTPVFLGFPGGSAGKESTCNVGDPGSKAGLGRSPGEGKGYPLQYSGPENSRDCIVHGVAKSRTQLSDFHFHFTFILYIEVSKEPYFLCDCFRHHFTHAAYFHVIIFQKRTGCDRLNNHFHTSNCGICWVNKLMTSSMNWFLCVT